MHRHLALPFLCLLGFLPDRLDAGAWPREQGKVFLSAGVSLAWPQDLSHWTSTAPTQDYRTIYMEYGLTNRLTLGFDLGRSVSGENKTIGFVQFPMRDKTTGARIALQLGLGQIGDRPIVRPGMAVGWPLDRGWFSADGVAEISLKDGATDLKLDVTWGRNLARDRKLILQMQFGAPKNDPSFARFAPSVVVPLRKGLKSEIGATWGISGDSSMGLKFGLWAEF